MINYKKIIKSRSLRVKILRLLAFIPDKVMIKMQYRIKTGHRLDLKNPQRFTEKLQWYKLNYKNPDMIRCVDKYDVREYVKEKGLKDILIPCLGVYENEAEIQWESLPKSFVIKDTLGVGGASVIIVEDKNTIDFVALKKTLNEWTSINPHIRDGGREWPYYNGKKHRIIIEHFLESDKDKGGLVDYKFFCFNGIPTWMYIISDRELGQPSQFGIYDMNFIKQDVQRDDEKPQSRVFTRPNSFEKMKQISSVLSKDFPEARIDLYDVNGKIRFGEITFFDGSGYMTFTPDSFDYEMGKAFILNK